MITEMIMLQETFANSMKEVEGIMKDVQRATWRRALNEVTDRLYEKQKMMENVLRNGRVIFEQTYGKKFDKMYDLRRQLWEKIDTLDKVYAIIEEVRKNQF